MPEAPKEIAVEGDVEVVTYENRESGFRVVKIAVDGRRDRLAVVGTFPSVAVGARIRARGTIQLDRTYGEQLRATSVTELAPTTLGGVEKYLASGWIKGIGPTFAARIVQRFGMDTLRVLDEEPERVREVPGLGATRAESLVNAWRDQRGMRDVMVFLQAHGASGHLAARIYKRYGAKAVSVVSGAPYRLALEVRGVGFRTADRIAAAMGIAKDSIERMQAALVQVLVDSMDAGHCFVGAEELTDAAARLLTADDDPMAGPSLEMASKLERALEEAIGAGYIVAERSGSLERAPAGQLAGAAIYEKRMYETEARVAERLAALAATRSVPLPGIDAALEQFGRETGTVLADEQRDAVQQAAHRPLLIVTGGPGVGKTTIVRAMLRMFERAGVSTRLAAPTGRAAKRMSEATGKEAVTLHRLLEFDPKSGAFKRDAKRPLDAGAIIVDESSMVDISMADALTQAVADGTRLVLVGDVDQLPSVGPGSVLRDAIASGVVPTVRLIRIFRQASSSLIVQNAHRINAGEMPILLPAPAGEPGNEPPPDFYLVERRDPEDARSVILEIVKSRIPRRFGFDPVRDIQVLTPMNRGAAGAFALNEALQAALNPHARGLVRGRVTFRIGDKVMQLKNDYDRNVWNGDLGIVSAVDEEDDSLVVRFDDGATESRDVEYDGAALDQLALAYACTIHKSQGSEYPVVVIPLLTSHFVMLSKNLLYTAVTRGKRLVVLVADPRALRLSLAPRDEARSTLRLTKLSQRIRAACGPPAR